MPILVKGQRAPIPVIMIVGRYFAAKEGGSPDYEKIEEHIKLAEKYAVILWNNGFAVFAPHLNTRHFETKTQVPESVYQEFDLFILRKVDGIFVLPNWKESTGGKREVRIAHEEVGIPVFDDVVEIIKWRLNAPYHEADLGCLYPHAVKKY